MTNTKDIVVLYHGGCFDGYGGAWAAWRHFKNKATYIALHRQTSPPLYLKNKTLYFIDFVYSLPIMKKFMVQNKRVTAIDHHVSGEAVTRTTVQPLYALHHSGAVLAWKYFHGQKPVPRLLRYIEDHDLWRFTLSRTREVMEMLELHTFEFRTWDRFAREIENEKKRKKIIENGKLLLRYHDEMMKRLVPNAERVRFEGYIAHVLNSPNFISEVGNLLVKKPPPIAIIWNRSKGSVRVSLRSNGKVNVANIAEKYGGGGHKAAAGFVVKSEKQLPWKYISVKYQVSGIKTK